MIEWNNGDICKYAQGLDMIFIGYDPFDSTHGYFVSPLHPEGANSPYEAPRTTNRLPMDRMTNYQRGPKSTYQQIALSLFIKAAEKFIDKVDSGRARSVETYNDLKDALAISKPVGQ